ncbi:uncharacterized protein [Mytilus edulis]|uniref:uncharacterized protein n=1 Tax=Mytilus edulis TaxID=6550 RepID=UPI0039EF6244
MAKAVAKAASRSLGLLISKCKAKLINGGFQYCTSTKLFDTLVWSVIDYGASIWGTRDFSCINSIKNRAIRFFMGVGKYTPNMSLYGEPCKIKQWTSVFRNWTRFNKMNDDRVNKKVFIWGNTCKKVKNWHFRVKNKFKELDMEYLCNGAILNKDLVKNIENVCFAKFKEEWYDKIMSDDKNKLRTYRMFKNVYGVENYLIFNIPGRYRSALAKFRCGVSPIRIETGRYENIDIENRLCFNCTDDVEDEKHVLLNCPVYSDIRNVIFNHASIVDENFLHMTDNEKFIFLFTNENMVFYTAKICYEILIKRKCILYS